MSEGYSFDERRGMLMGTLMACHVVRGRAEVAQGSVREALIRAAKELERVAEAQAKADPGAAAFVPRPSNAPEPAP